MCYTEKGGAAADAVALPFLCPGGAGAAFAGERKIEKDLDRWVYCC